MSASWSSKTRLKPPFALDVDDDSVSLDDSATWGTAESPGYRTGGPKEARLHRVALLAASKEVDHLHPVKVGNIPRTASAEKLKEQFADFGEIGDVYIPTRLKKLEPAKDFAVVRFSDKASAEKALNAPKETLSTKQLSGNQLVVSPVKKQASFFSNNTGRLGINNEPVISHVPPDSKPPEQDISVEFIRSRSGYPWGSVRELKYLNPKPPSDTLELHSLKLIDLPHTISKQQIGDAFIKFGEIGAIQVPMPQIVTEQTFEPNNGIAFVRYKDRRDLTAAMKELDAGNIIIDGHALKGELQLPNHWPSEKTRRYY